MIKGSLHNLKTWLLCSLSIPTYLGKIIFWAQAMKNVSKSEVFIFKDVIYSYNRILLTLKKKIRNLDICGNMDEPGGHYSKGNHPDTERQMPHDFTHMWNLKLLFSHSAASNSWQPRGLQHTRHLCLSLSPGVCSNSGHWVNDAIQPSHPFLPPFPPTLNLSSIRVFSS